LLFRLEWELAHGGATGQEGLWLFYPDEFASAVDGPDMLRLFGELWSERPVSGGPSRQELLPSDVFLQLGRVKAFLIEFLQVESELASAIFGIPSRPDRLPLPPVVSKEIQLMSNLGGKGRFGRIHTAFHPQLAVDDSDPRNCTAAYLAALLEWFQLVVDFFNSLGYARDPHTHEVILFQVVVVHVDRPRSLGTGLASPVHQLRGVNRRWGTMRRRGAVVRH